MSELDPDEPTPSYLLRRNEDPITSHMAAELVDTEVTEDRILKIIQSFGEIGCISDQVQEACGINERVVPYSSVTGPYVNLERKCFIERNGDMRLGHRFQRWQLVMRALTPEQRELRLQAIASNKAFEPTPEDMDLIKRWYEAYKVLEDAKEAEMLVRDLVIQRFFSHAVMGPNKFNFPGGGALVYHKRRKSGFLLPLETKS